jgi:hypothetical protein
MTSNSAHTIKVSTSTELITVESFNESEVTEIISESFTSKQVEILNYIPILQVEHYKKLVP